VTSTSDISDQIHIKNGDVANGKATVHLLQKQNGIPISKIIRFWVAKKLGVHRLPLFWWRLGNNEPRFEMQHSVMEARNRDNSAQNNAIEAVKRPTKG
jgi:hypothetical protein